MNLKKEINNKKTQINVVKHKRGNKERILILMTIQIPYYSAKKKNQDKISFNLCNRKFQVK